MLRIDAEPQLASLTSLHLGGKALALVAFSDLRDLESLPETLARIGGRVVPIGGGTNILAPDGLLPVTLLRCEIREEPEIVGQEGDAVLVRVGAGMKLPRLVAWCSRRGLSGLEGMAGVPGNVGGAIAGNAGAHGMDMGMLLRRLTVFSPQTGVTVLDRTGFCSAYRHFSLPGMDSTWFVLAEAVLALRQSTAEAVCAAVRSHVARKLSVQPVRAWSAGCLFKNPDPEETTLSAGKLLDEAGFRGKRVGGMCLSPIHANFLVNEGNGSAGAALQLVHEAQEAVLRLFGISLHPEVKIWAF